MCVYTCMQLYSEMFEANRWHNDPQFFSPMASVDGFQVFVGEIVHCLKDSTSYAKIVKFMTEVCFLNY